MLGCRVLGVLGVNEKLVSGRWQQRVAGYVAGYCSVCCWVFCWVCCWV